MNVKGDHSKPAPRIVTAGKDIKIIVPGNVRRVSPESESSIELNSHTVTAKKRDVVSLDRETTGVREGQEAMRVEYNSIEMTVTPIVRIQNRGELPYEIVDNPSEVI